MIEIRKLNEIVAHLTIKKSFKVKYLEVINLLKIIITNSKIIILIKVLIGLK